MGSIEWNHPMQIPQADGESISTLVQSGIKFFLHQRNQIPLPLEQLARSSEELIKYSHNPQNTDVNSSLLQNVEEEDEDPQQRIRRMTLRRKRLLGQNKRRRKEGNNAKKEAIAAETLTCALESLDRLIKTISSSDLWAVSLIFGSSIPSLKELILFEFPTQEFRDSSKRCNASADLIPVIRSFYKSIIMSEEFCELTSKSLNSTRSHICLLTRKELAQETRGDLIQLEETEWLKDLLVSHLQSENSTSSSQDLSSFSCSNSMVLSNRRNSKVKVLRVKMALGNNCNGNDSDDKKNLLDNNSFCCYQIPLRFKGLQCKNKY